VNRKVYILKHF